MSLLAPLFLLGGLAVALPLWLHLLQRENPIRLPFSSLMFFERRPQSSMRERRLRYLLLLSLRILCYALLALAFAKPVWERATGAALGNVPRLHLIALDTSMSMQFGDRWERAVAEAMAVVDSMERGDRAQMLASGPGVRVITERTEERQQLVSAIRSLQPTASKNSFGDLAEAVRALVGEQSLPVVLHVISDFQQSAMPARFADIALPTLVSLQAHNVSEGDSPNWAVESIRGTTRLGGGQEARLEVTIAGFGTEKAEKQVKLILDGKTVAAKSVEAPASGRATVVFENFEAPAGNSRGEIVLEPGDDLPLDDRRLVAIDNSKAASILFVSNDPRKRDLLYYRAALDASAQSLFQVESASAPDLARVFPEQYALVVISDVPQLSSLFAGRLENYVRSGGSVLLAMGVKTTLAGKAPLYNGRIQEVRYAGREGERFQTAGRLDESHPVLRQVERFRGVKFFRYALLSANEGDDVLARLADGSPLLVEQQLGQGRVLAFASSLDNVWNDLPVHPVFVPFATECARYLAGMEEDGGQAIVDSVLELSSRRNLGSSVQVFDPGGERVLTLSEAVTGQDVRLNRLGFYEVRRPGKTELTAVNPDPRESNLRPMDAETVALWEATGRSQQEAAPAAVEAVQLPPVKIWWFVLFLFVLVSLIESIVGNWHLKVQREV